MRATFVRIFSIVVLSSTLIFSSLSANAGGSFEEAYKPKIWQGFYVGGHFGLSIAESEVSLVGIDLVSLDDDSFAAGIHVGYNWQRNNIVYGIEGDFTWIGTDYDVLNVEVASIDSLGSVRGRLGYAINDLLLFATAGVAWKDTDTIINLDLDDTGYVIGAGAELKFGARYSLKGELLHYRFENEDVLGTAPFNVDIDTDITTIRTGFSVHF